MDQYIFNTETIKRTVTKDELLAMYPEADGVIEYPHTLSWKDVSHIISSDESPYKKHKYILLPVTQKGEKGVAASEVNENAFIVQITEIKHPKWRELGIEQKIQLTKNYKHIRDEYSAVGSLSEFKMKLIKPLFIDVEEIIELETENLVNEIDNLFGLEEGMESYLEFIDRPIGQVLSDDPNSVLHRQTVVRAKQPSKRKWS